MQIRRIEKGRLRVQRTLELGLEAWISFGHMDHSGRPLQGKEAVNARCRKW